jgi:CRISPR-associated protein Csm2
MSINLVTPDIHLFAKTAEDAAKMIANSSNQRMNKATQLRGFYDEILNWEQRSRQLDTEQFKAQLPLIHMLIAKVAYAGARGNVSPDFEKLIRDCISQVTDKTTLKHCKLFFEAFMGFYKVYGPK